MYFVLMYSIDVVLTFINQQFSFYAVAFIQLIIAARKSEEFHI